LTMAKVQESSVVSSGSPRAGAAGIRAPSRVFVARHGRELTNLVLTRAQVDEMVERMLEFSGLDLP
jgi:hypothetical protein